MAVPFLIRYDPLLVLRRPSMLEQQPGLVPPEHGQTWPRSGSEQRFGAGYASYATQQLTAGQAEMGTITMRPGYRIYAIATDRPARVRLYTTTAKRNADISRELGLDPIGDHGLVLEYVTTPSLLSADLSPEVDGVDQTGSGGLIPITVTNRDTGAASVLVTFEYLRTA